MVNGFFHDIVVCAHHPDSWVDLWHLEGDCFLWHFFSLMTGLHLPDDKGPYHVDRTEMDWVFYPELALYFPVTNQIVLL